MKLRNIKFKAGVNLTKNIYSKSAIELLEEGVKFVQS